MKIDLELSNMKAYWATALTLFCLTYFWSHFIFIYPKLPPDIRFGGVRDECFGPGCKGGAVFEEKGKGSRSARPITSSELERMRIAYTFTFRYVDIFLLPISFILAYPFIRGRSTGRLQHSNFPSLLRYCLKRLAAFGIDCFCLFLGPMLLLAGMSAVFGSEFDRKYLHAFNLDTGPFYKIIFTFYMTFSLAYFWLFGAALGGTPGKVILGLKIVTGQGRKPLLLQSFHREALGRTLWFVVMFMVPFLCFFTEGLPVVLCLFGILWIAVQLWITVQPEQGGLHNWMANTWVIEESYPGRIRGITGLFILTLLTIPVVMIAMEMLK